MPEFEKRTREMRMGLQREALIGRLAAKLSIAREQFIEVIENVVDGRARVQVLQTPRRRSRPQLQAEASLGRTLLKLARVDDSSLRAIEERVDGELNETPWMDPAYLDFPGAVMDGMRF